MELERAELLVYFKQSTDFQPKKFRNILQSCLKHAVKMTIFSFLFGKLSFSISSHILRNGWCSWILCVWAANAQIVKKCPLLLVSFNEVVNILTLIYWIISLIQYISMYCCSHSVLTDETSQTFYYRKWGLLSIWNSCLAYSTQMHSMKCRWPLKNTQAILLCRGEIFLSVHICCLE